jgi:hypothetical protein
MQGSIKIGSITVYLCFILVFCAGICCAEMSSDGKTIISSAPFVIYSPGSYILTADLRVTNPNAHAINIRCNDVTVDLNGFTVQGPGTKGTAGCGIFGYNRDSITIKNGRIWGFGRAGIFLYTKRDEGHGGGSGAGHIVDFVQTPNNFEGMQVSGGIINNCTSCNNPGNGFKVFFSSMLNCTANNNGNRGIDALECTISSCSTCRNKGGGINISNCVLNKCVSSNNTMHGINSRDSVISECVANKNTNDGVYAKDTCISNSQCSYNTFHGISAEASYVRDCYTDDNKICQVRDVGDYGFNFVKDNFFGFKSDCEESASSYEGNYSWSLY